MLDPRVTIEYENKILELIDDRDEFTRSDLQGVVAVLVNKIMEAGHEILKERQA